MYKAAFELTDSVVYGKRRITTCGAPKSSSTPPTAQMVGAFGLIFDLGVHHGYISGAIEAIFEFPPTVD